MVVFTSSVSQRSALEQLLMDSLNLAEDGRTRQGRRPREGLARARLALGDARAFSAEVLRTYRRRARLPDGLLQGAALALFGDSALTLTGSVPGKLVQRGDSIACCGSIP